MLFSQRTGLEPLPKDLCAGHVSDALRNSLWTAVRVEIVEKLTHEVAASKPKYEMTAFCRQLWVYFLKLPIDNIPQDGLGLVRKDEFWKHIKKWFFEYAEWNKQLDFLEYCAGNLSSRKAREFTDFCNHFFEIEFSAYRFVKNQIVEVTTEEEIAEIEQALEIGDEYSPVRTHLEASLQLLSDKKNPDFRNSMKESISAVESLCKIITGDKNATLGDSLKVIEKKYPLHESLKKAFSALYGYTSDSGGIRHSLKDEVSDLKFEDAKFMLVICSAFVNYLIAKTT